MPRTKQITLFFTAVPWVLLPLLVGLGTPLKGEIAQTNIAQAEDYETFISGVNEAIMSTRTSDGAEAKRDWLNIALRDTKKRDVERYEKLWWLLQLERFDSSFDRNFDRYQELSNSELRAKIETLPQTPSIRRLFPFF